MTRLSGHFRDTGNRTWKPYIKARVEVPRLSVRGSVDFLIDTGADKTTLHPMEKRTIGMQHADLDATKQNTYNGIGGAVVYSLEDVVLHFKKADRSLSVAVGPLASNLFVEAQNLRIPSLLGRDVLDQGSLVSDFISNQLYLDLHSDEEISREKVFVTSFDPARYAKIRAKR